MYIKGKFKKYSQVVAYIPAKITKQPVSNIIAEKTPFSFNIEIIGTKPIEYKWYRNNFPIKDSNSNTLTFSNPSLSDDANYYCSVKNNRFYEETIVVHLSVQTIPIIYIQPLSSTVNVGDTYNFNVSADDSSKKLNYQWYKQDNILLNSTSNKLYINNISKNDQGYYYVTISNRVAMVTSKFVLLSVYP
jgi:hypothetical protein